MDVASLAPADAGCVGEVWASGPSVAAGYWGQPEATAATFVEHGGRRWLRTGDLGFLHEGQLVVTGRTKDLIILRGHNVYPQDVERTIEAEVEAVRKGRVAVFPVQGGAGRGHRRGGGGIARHAEAGAAAGAGGGPERGRERGGGRAAVGRAAAAARHAAQDHQRQAAAQRLPRGLGGAQRRCLRHL